MTIHPFYFNPYRECTYVVWDEQSSSGNALLIDAGMYGEREEDRLRSFLTQHGLTPVALLITHTHPDHVCGVDFVRSTYGLEPTIFPSEGLLTIRNVEGEAVEAFADIEVLHTPGHKEDCVCYYFRRQGWLFTGDTLFEESIGRTDLPGGDMGQLIQSLKRLSSLPDATEVYPGHGYKTTIGHEKEYNPYL